jgi:uncharacterized lipoprotein YajG
MKKKKLFSLIAIILFSGCLSDSSTWERVDAETFNQEINDN